MKTCLINLLLLLSMVTSTNRLSAAEAFGMSVRMNETGSGDATVTSLFDTSKLYVLRSAGDTYLKLNDNDDDGSSSNVATAVSYSTTPSQFTISASGSGYVFQDENGHYIGIRSGRYWWNVDNTTQAVWTIEPVSDVADGYYISCSNGYLGNEGNVSDGTGIYNNQSSAILWYIKEYVASDFMTTYTVNITGNDGGGLVYDGTTYSSEFSAPKGLTASSVTAVSVEGYRTTITLSGTTYTITYIANQKADNPEAIIAFLNRIGGIGTSDRIETTLDESLYHDGQDAFIITSRNGKPCVQGSSYSAITTGIGWYLNHYAHVNLTWNNNVTTTLSGVMLPVPETEEKHTCDADYRYYLNYCTFGYSMTTWTWDRWEKEIDWMALHGINMPLQIVGLEQVWKTFLMEDCGYSESDAEAFVPGPAYTGWWGMNNLQGWGGDGTDQTLGVTDNAWYARQVELAQKIVERERALGMEPVLPGFSGMMPAGFSGAESQGGWCGFQRPYILDPTNNNFATYAAQYYKRLEEVMGTSKYYSMDPFHEGGSISSGAYAQGYEAIYNAMNTNCGSDSKWVIQQWQWASYQAYSLTSVPSGRLIVLDLFSDGNPAFDSYNGYAPQEAIYCAIPNFGGRTGFFGRIPKMANNYFKYKNKYSTVKGIGAAPEAIEQTPVVYDLLFELPWLGSEPDTKAWIQDYALARYGIRNNDAQTAWEQLLESALNNTTTLQGPHEAVVCARPSLSVNTVSTWGGTSIFYDQQQVIDAAFKLLAAGKPGTTNGDENYSYDLCDITRQALTDYSKSLLASINEYSGDTSSEAFTTRRDAFLQLILDLDELLGTNRMFRLGNWTETARNAAAEVSGATTATADWYELNNARQLITTWGDYGPSEGSGLRDYSYREWQGMLKDFYYPRWNYWFSHGMSAPSAGWFYTDWNWAHDTGKAVGASAKGTTAGAASRTYYTAEPEGDTYTIAEELLNKYFTPKTLADGSTHYDCYLLESATDDLWTIPTQNLSDLSTIKSYSQYINSMSAEVNSGDAAQIYSTAECPTTLYHHTDSIEVKQGDLVTITWAGNDGLKYCYLTVYLDEDGNGTFDKVVKKVGTSGSTNSSVCNGSVSITIPSDLSAAVTHARFRFDSAWNIASTADDATTRMVYEIPFVLSSTGGGDDMTGMQDINTTSSSADNIEFDLSGRCVSKTTKGVHIIQGKKVLR